MKNCKKQPLRLLIFYISCFYIALSVGEPQDSRKESSSTEFEKLLLKNVTNNYPIGFVELKNFLNSINLAFSALKADIANLKVENQIIKAQIIKVGKSVNGSSLSEIKSGKSFNGSTLSEIKSRASKVGKDGSYKVVVFVNHLDEAIQDFKIRENVTYNPAPKSIPPHTQEIFTFAKSSDDWISTSFSYAIPSAGIRVAAISTGGAYTAGLAFVSNDTNMRYYFANPKGIEGSWAYETIYGTDKNLSVSYKNLQATLFSHFEGTYKATVRIELMKLPLLD